MAFPQANAQRELANRKILEDLQLKKQLLLKQGVASTLNPASLPVLGTTNSQSTDGYSMTSVQRATLQTANAQSMGYFISQDSSFDMWPCMKLKNLESQLQSIQGFESPKILLEQYATPSHLSSQMLYMIQSQYGDITDRIVADLGCGCGGLAIGCGILDAAFVMGFEIDSDALDIYQENVEEQELTNMDAILGDVLQLSNRFDKMFDTVVMNPPFGTKHNAGMDMKFLATAVKLAQNSVYSLHKTSTRSHIYKVSESLGVNCEVLAQLHYDLPSTYKFHKKKTVDIEVDFIRFSIK